MKIDTGTYVIDFSALKTMDNGDVLLHLPEGLMPKAGMIIDGLRACINGRVHLYGEGAFGSCDIPLAHAKELGIKTIVHVGHPPLANLPLPGDVNVVFASAVMKIDEQRFSDALHELTEMLKADGIEFAAVATTVQHLNIIQRVVEGLNTHGIEATLCNSSGRVNIPGVVLGCNFANVRCPDANRGCDHGGVAAVFVGTGRFHPLGIAMNTSLRTYALNPITGDIEVFDSKVREKIIKKRFAAIERAMNATEFGIILSVKPGQNRSAMALDLLAKGTAHGKKCTLVVVDTLNPEALDNLDFEAYVNTACPRISIDDYFRFKRPMLTPLEFLIAIGAQEFNPDTYRFDEMH